MVILRSNFHFDPAKGTLSFRTSPVDPFYSLRPVVFGSTATFCLGVPEDFFFCEASDVLAFVADPTDSAPYPELFDHAFPITDLPDDEREAVGSYALGLIDAQDAQDDRTLKAARDMLSAEYSVRVVPANTPKIAALYKAACTKYAADTPAEPTPRTVTPTAYTPTADDDFLSALGTFDPTPVEPLNPVSPTKPVIHTLTPAAAITITSPTPPELADDAPRANLTVRTVDGGASWDLPALSPEELAAMAGSARARSKWGFDDMEVGGRRAFEPKIAGRARAAVHVYALRSNRKFNTKTDKATRILTVTRIA